MQQTVSRIFVYGSLRRGFQAPAFEYISRYFLFESDAKVRGRLYDMGTYPAAIPTNDEAFLIGELYHIKNEEELYWALEQLDAYEGIHSDPEDGGMLYRRALVEVITPVGNTTAWIYWYNCQITDQPIVASGDMLEYLYHQQKKG